MLLVETQNLTESLKEEGNWYISGIMAQAEVVNRNKRIYRESVLSREMNNFVNEFVSTSRAVGELSHPNHSQINPDRIAIKITEMLKEGNDWSGKALVLGTPCGKIIQSLLEGGVKVGVSTRGSGDVKTLREGVSEVQDNFKLHTIDAVMNPSAPNALMNAVYENENVMDALLSDSLLYEEFSSFLKAKKKAKAIPNKVNRDKALYDASVRVLANLINK